MKLRPPLSLRYSERFFSQATFYAQAAAGALPAVSWLHPPIQACDHPCQVGATSRRSVVGDEAEARFPPPSLFSPSRTSPRASGCSRTCTRRCACSRILKNLRI